MKLSIRITMLLVLLALTGCHDAPPPGAATPETSGLAAAQQHATKTIDATAINKAIELFYVQTGRFPTTLTELASKNFVPEIPLLPAGMSWSYDTNTGIALIVKTSSPDAH